MNVRELIEWLQALPEELQEVPAVVWDFKPREDGGEELRVFLREVRDEPGPEDFDKARRLLGEPIEESTPANNVVVIS